MKNFYIGRFMKKLIQILTWFSILTFVFCSNSLATDFGFFLEGSSGSGEFEFDSELYSFDIDTNNGSIGFVLDTATMNENTFNYRLNVGASNLKLEDDLGDELDSNGIYVDNIFGFALIKNETFRWWLGPSIRLGYYWGDKYEIDYSFAEFGVGVVTGVNFKVGNSAILTPSIGIRINGYAGTAEDPTGYDEDFTFNSTVGFVNLAILF